MGSCKPQGVPRKPPVKVKVQLLLSDNEKQTTFKVKAELLQRSDEEEDNSLSRASLGRKDIRKCKTYHVQSTQITVHCKFPIIMAKPSRRIFALSCTSDVNFCNDITTLKHHTKPCSSCLVMVNMVGPWSLSSLNTYALSGRLSTNLSRDIEAWASQLAKATRTYKRAKIEKQLCMFNHEA